MKVEIHSHTNIHSQCSVIPPRELVTMADACGYDAVFITEHHKIWRPTELNSLREWSSRLRVFSGVEISFGGGIDVLIVGAQDPVYEELRDPDDVFAQATADGLLTVIAHPYRWADVLPDYCTLADAIELRTCNHPLPDQADRARAYAEKHHLALVNSGDSHGLNFLNRFWLETDGDFTTPQEFRRLILANRYANHERNVDSVLPPDYKAAAIDELREADAGGLPQPVSNVE